MKRFSLPKRTWRPGRGKTRGTKMFDVLRLGDTCGHWARLLSYQVTEGRSRRTNQLCSSVTTHNEIEDSSALRRSKRPCSPAVSSRAWSVLRKSHLPTEVRAKHQRRKCAAGYVRQASRPNSSLLAEGRTLAEASHRQDAATVGGPLASHPILQPCALGQCGL